MTDPSQSGDSTTPRRPRPGYSGPPRTGAPSDEPYYGDPSGQTSGQPPNSGDQPYGQQGQQPGYGRQAYDQPDYSPRMPYEQPAPYGQAAPYGQPGYGGQPAPAPYQPSYGGQPAPAPYQPSYGGQPAPAPYQPSYGGQPAPAPYQPSYGGGYAPAAPATPKRTRLLLTSSAIVVVLAAGGVATYAAVSDSSSAGAGSPKAAVQSVITDLNNSDVIGLLDDLAPPERTALAKPIQNTITELKRNDVLSKRADATKVSGLTITAKNFTYAPGTITINDHVQIVQITGGTITVDGDASKLPLSKDLLDAVVPGGLHDKQTQTYDIATELKKAGRISARVAAEKVGSTWYPSLFYTVADNATYKKGAPTASDAIPAVGAASADDAVTALLTNAAKGDVDGIVGDLAPDEMAVLHDYGRLIFPQSHFASPFNQFQFSGLTYGTQDIGDGGTLVTTKSATITINGRTITTKRVGDCYSVTANGQTKDECPGASGSSSIANLLRGLTGRELTARQTTAVSDAFSALTKLGVVTSESNGKWYLDPVRTIATIIPTALSGLKSGDLLALISIGQR